MLGGLKKAQGDGAWSRRQHPAYRGPDLADKALSGVRGLQDSSDGQQGGEKREDRGIRGSFGQKELSVLECPPEGQAYPREVHVRH